ncbi:MAG: DUF3726 domain-containing protein [Candidatus Puniceispirillaceae bacterium]
MSWSLGETGALAVKATRGAGFSWGIAEDAGFAVTWLLGRGLPGAAALCSYLGWHASQRHLQLETDMKCPLLTGAAISDGVIALPDAPDDRVALGMVRMPLLLVPFVACLGDEDIWIHGLQMPERMDESPPPPVGMAACSLHRGGVPDWAAAAATHTRLGSESACCVETLGRLAHRTYAPATQESRLAGAGAGLTDND